MSENSRQNHIEDYTRTCALFKKLLGIISTLRSPEGCPWDREQTPDTLRANLLEEAYEAVEALNSKNTAHIREELGDLLLLVAMISQMHMEDGSFSIDDVISDISDKLIRRHPHVFADTQVSGTEEVLHNWEKIKETLEGKTKNSVLDRIPSNIPPLLKAWKIQKKVAKEGFDWPDARGPKQKILEELEEIEQEVSKQEVSKQDDNLETELGDLLFSVVNYARHLGVNPALALQKSSKKFEERFRLVEARMKADKAEMSPETLALMDRYWEEAKKEP